MHPGNSFKRLLGAKTASTINFAKKEKLVDHIAAVVLSETYGGLREEYPIPSKYIKEEAYI